MQYMTTASKIQPGARKGSFEVVAVEVVGKEVKISWKPDGCADSWIGVVPAESEISLDLIL